jgi:hypothetical protein
LLRIQNIESGQILLQCGGSGEDALCGFKGKQRKIVQGEPRGIAGIVTSEEISPNLLYEVDQ